MKPHLPITLLTAVLASFIAFPAQAAEVPSDYTSHYLESAGDLYDYRSDTGKHAFLLDGSVSFTAETATWWSSQDNLKYNGYIIFTHNEDETPYSLTFKNASYRAFSVNTLTIEDLGRITFEDIHSYNGSAVGGAIYATNLNLNGNKSVTVKGNSAQCSSSFISFGGAIYGAHNSSISLSSNEGDINISENSATSSSSSYSYGGAIYVRSSSSITLNNNGGNVNISGNSATFSSYSTTSSYGGAIYGEDNSSITINNNGGDINISGNSVTANYSLGGAICLEYESTITISNNRGNVSITDNYISSISRGSSGGAIYNEGDLYLQNNGDVLIAGNYEKEGNTYRLRSIYMDSISSDGGHFELSAAAGKKIEFLDSVYISTSTSGRTVNVVYNGSYTDEAGNSIAQTGDIIFDGKDVASTLERIKGSAATEEELANSLTSYIEGMTSLEAGRLIIRNGAQYNGLGISTTARSGAAVVLQDAGMNHGSSSINIKRGTSLELSGINSISAEYLTLSSAATLKFGVDGDNRESAVLNLDANFEHYDNLTIAVNGEDMLLSGRYKLLELASADQYVDLDGYWNADDVNVSGTGDAAGAEFDNLVWENGTLYFEQGKTIWSNNSGNNLWNTGSANWQRNGVDITYRNGMDVLFTDSGAGTVQLVGEIAPHSITVENSEGNNYSFIASAEGGKLTGDTAIEKKGDGELTLATANEHTGGTDLQGGTLRVQHSAALGAADATLTTAAGTLLSIENGTDVTLSATDNQLAGQVAVADGASLQVQSGGYAAESTVLNGNLSFTAGANGTSAGSLSGNGKLSVSGTATQVHFNTISGYSGGMAVSGNGASLSVDDGDYSGSGALSVSDGATLNLSNSAVELKQSGSLSMSGGAELHVESLRLEQGTDLLAIMSENSFSVAELSEPEGVNIIMQTDKLSFEGSFADGQVLNVASAGRISAANGLTLEGGSTYTANGSHLDLNGGSLSFEDLSTRINLNLTLSLEELPSDYRIVLFSGVSGITFDSEYFSTMNTAHVFAASDFFISDYITADTALVYDSAASVVFLAQGEAVPEPTTATLSLLALAALAARRRRQK